jgi:hypothetical protein
MKRFLLAIDSWLKIIFTIQLGVHKLCRSNTAINFLKVSACLLLLITFLSLQVNAQLADKTQQQNDYKKVVTERVKKFVDPIQLTDSAKYKEVISVITNQYIKLNAIHEESALAVTALKAKGLTKPELDSAIRVQEDNKSVKLQQQHHMFINQLEKNLSPTQIEQVKNGMTYNVLNVTYKGYQDMIPTLKTEEKEKIYNWLVEARELAMDAESSDKKHAVFGKYKGRINNYLSAQGYDSKKEREQWEARLKTKKDADKSSN